MNMRLTAALFMIAMLLMTGCGRGARNTASNTNAPANSGAANANKEKPAANRTDDEAALRAADLAWSEAAGKKDIEAVVGVMTDDGSTLPPNEPIQNGKDAIRKGWTGLLGLKDMTISWSPSVVHVAESGETGYTSGIWSMTFTDPKGAKLMDKGKYLEVWKKVDGRWKCYLDIYNSDLPTPAPQ